MSLDEEKKHEQRKNLALWLDENEAELIMRGLNQLIKLLGNSRNFTKKEEAEELATRVNKELGVPRWYGCGK